MNMFNVRMAWISALMSVSATALAVASVTSGLSNSANSPAAASIAPSRYVMTTGAVNGIAIAELSGLAWDADEQLLYAVSDQGYVYHFKLTMNGNDIALVKPVFAARLVDARTGSGSVASGKHFNAEGLAVRYAHNGKRGDSELWVAAEENPPQIMRFNPSGTFLGYLPVPPPANDMAHLQKKNRGLESVAMHPVYGLISAPESALRSQPTNQHAIYAQGYAWSFPSVAAGSRLKGIEVLADGDLLVLERSRQGSKSAQVASLRRVELKPCANDGLCKTSLLASLPTAAHNFEGMSLLDAKHVLLVADNGGDLAQSTHFILVTLP